MGCPTKVQLSKRKNSEQWYVNFPAQVAQAMDFSRGEVVEWRLEDRATMALTRKEPPQWSKKPSPGYPARTSAINSALNRGPKRWGVKVVGKMKPRIISRASGNGNQRPRTF